MEITGLPDSSGACGGDYAASGFIVAHRTAPPAAETASFRPLRWGPERDRRPPGQERTG